MAVHLHRTPPNRCGAPTFHDFVSAAPFLIGGMAMGTFVLVASAVLLRDIGSHRSVLALIVPLMLSLGVAEIMIRRFQQGVKGHLVKAHDLVEFSDRAQQSTIRYAGVYLLFLTILEAIGLAALGGEADRVVVGDYALILLLGFCMFVTLLLMAMDHVVPVVVGFSIASLWLIGGSLAGLAVLSLGPALLVTLALATALAVAAFAAVAQPQVHGFG